MKLRWFLKLTTFTFIFTQPIKKCFYNNISNTSTIPQNCRNLRTFSLGPYKNLSIQQQLISVYSIQVLVAAKHFFYEQFYQSQSISTRMRSLPECNKLGPQRITCKWPQMWIDAILLWNCCNALKLILDHSMGIGTVDAGEQYLISNQTVVASILLMD